MIASHPIAVFAVALAVALAAGRALLSGPARRFALDHPNPRSLHAEPVPRTGGLAIGIATAAALWWSASAMAAPWFALALALVSLADDLRGLPTLLRLGAHLLAAVAFVLLAFPDLPVAWHIVLVLGVGWLTNLYNFMDGSDGLAGGMAIAGFGAYAIAAQADAAAGLAIVSSAVAGAALGFLAFNFHPARIFLGDVGSIPLGFLAGALGLLGWRDGVWPLWFPLLVFAPFVADATLTLAKRALRGERVWQAHRDHYYQRLVRMGWGHRRTALAGYALMLACAAAALAVRRAGISAQAAVLIAAAMVFIGVALWTDARWRQHTGAAH